MSMKNENVIKFIVSDELIRIYKEKFGENLRETESETCYLSLSNFKEREGLIHDMIEMVKFDIEDLKKALKEFEMFHYIMIESIDMSENDCRFEFKYLNIKALDDEYSFYRTYVHNTFVNLTEDELNKFYKTLGSYIDVRYRMEMYHKKLVSLEKKETELNSGFDNSIFNFSDTSSQFFKFLDLFNKEFNLLLSSIPLRNINLPVRICEKINEERNIYISNYVISPKYGLKVNRYRSNAEIPLANLASFSNRLLYLESIKELSKNLYDEKKLDKAIELYDKITNDFCENPEYRFFFGKQFEEFQISENLTAEIPGHLVNVVFKLKNRFEDYCLFEDNPWKEDEDFYKEVLKCWDVLYLQISNKHKELNLKVEKLFSFLEIIKNENKNFKALRRLI